MDALELRFSIPARAPSINELSGHHWARRRRALEPWRDSVMWAWILTPIRDRSKICGVPCNVHLTIPFRTGQRRDPHNYTGTVGKAVVDALVEKGVWPDDTAEWVTMLDPTLVKGDEVVVTLSPR